MSAGKSAHFKMLFERSCSRMNAHLGNCVLRQQSSCYRARHPHLMRSIAPLVMIFVNMLLDVAVLPRAPCHHTTTSWIVAPGVHGFLRMLLGLVACVKVDLMLRECVTAIRHLMPFSPTYTAYDLVRVADSARHLEGLPMLVLFLLILERLFASLAYDGVGVDGKSS
jgi:hypothetical protein